MREICTRCPPRLSGAAARAAPQLTSSLSSLPGMNLGTRRAAILMRVPVWGLRPFRARRRAVWNDPNPTRVTFSPLRSDFVTLSSMASIARNASALVRPVSRATRSMSSALFMPPPADALGLDLEHDLRDLVLLRHLVRHHQLGRVLAGLVLGERDGPDAAARHHAVDGHRGRLRDGLRPLQEAEGGEAGGGTGRGVGLEVVSLPDDGGAVRLAEHQRAVGHEL